MPAITPGRSGAGRGTTTAGLLVPSEQFVRLSPIPAVLIDASDRCRVVNEQFVETFGYVLREIPTIQDWFRLVLPGTEERGRVAEAWRETAGLEEGAIHHQSVSVRCRDGGERRIVLRTAVLEDGSRFVTCEDLSGLFLHHEALCVANRTLMEIIEFLPDPTFVLDTAGEVIAWNRAIEELTGVPKDEMLGRGACAYAVPFYGVPRPLLADLVLREGEEGIEAYTMVSRQGRTLVAETFISSWNGGTGVHLWGKASPLFGPEGRVSGAIESIRDITEYRRTEQGLRRSEEKYRGLVETIRDIIYEVTAGGVITYVSPAVAPATGYSPDALVGRSFLDLVHPEDRDRIRQRLVQALAGGSGPEDFRLRMPSGEVRWFRTAARPALTDGKPTGLRGVLTDITDRVAAEAAVRWDEALLAQMAEASPFGYYVVDDRTDRILYFNDRFCDLWHLSDLRERMRRGEIVHGEILPRCRGMARDGEAFSGPPGETESAGAGGEIVLLDGRRIWQYSTPIRDDGGRCYGRFHLFEDVTEQRRLVEELRQYRDRLEETVRERTGALVEANRQLCSEIAERERATRAAVESDERFRRIFDQAPIGMAIVSLENRFLRVNRALSAITGYTEEELLAAGPREITHPDDLEAGSDLTGRLIAGDCDDDVREIRYVRKNGGPVWVRMTMRVVHDPTGRPLHLLSMTEDVTDRKEAEERLRVYAGELARSNEDLQQFAYVASHDLQEPLRSIVSFSQLLERRCRGRLDEDADEYIEFIVRGGQRMQALIRDLLQVSRIGTQAKPVAPTDTDAVVYGALRALEAPIRETGASVTVEALPAVMADWSQLEQVFVNLVGNAIKYGRPGVPPAIRIQGWRVGPMVEFAVADNGIGIEAKYYDRIFEMFRRLHSHDEYEGTGIGLAVVRKIVDRHGGTIRVESTAGEGSTFFFTLPAA